MNTLLWILQAVAALVYGASGVMKVFMFEKVSRDVPSFGALSRKVWKALGVLELGCVVGLILPAVLHWHPTLVVVAATLLAAESLLFIWVHARYRERASIMLSGGLGIVMALIAYGRLIVAPLL